MNHDNKVSLDIYRNISLQKLLHGANLETHLDGYSAGVITVRQTGLWIIYSKQDVRGTEDREGQIGPQHAWRKRVSEWRAIENWSLRCMEM